MHPAIVINAYNRPAALKRLLASVQQAAYPAGENIRLHISIDRGEDGCSSDVLEIAESVPWPYGDKRVECQERHLGLIPHFYHCGDLAHEYGAIILLEDDLVVSPVYYTYVSKTIDYYESDPRIAGLSLYTLWFNGYTQEPFSPLSDDADVFFLQVPYTQGQAFSSAQWQRFTTWQNAENRQVHPGDYIHEMFLRFAPDEWFPIRTKYLIDTSRFYVFPRESLVTGFGDPGAHFSKPSYFFQVPLQRFKVDYCLKKFDESVAVYDSFFEILPDRLNQLTGQFSGYSYEVDLYGTKSRANLELKTNSEYVLTSRRCISPLATFGKYMWPMEANIIEGIPGNEISFCRKKNLDWSWLAGLALKKQSYEYFTRHRQIGKRLQLQFYLLQLLENLRGRRK